MGNTGSGDLVFFDIEDTERVEDLVRSILADARASQVAPGPLVPKQERTAVEGFAYKVASAVTKASVRRLCETLNENMEGHRFVPGARGSVVMTLWPGKPPSPFELLALLKRKGLGRKCANLVAGYVYDQEGYVVPRKSASLDLPRWPFPFPRWTDAKMLTVLAPHEWCGRTLLKAAHGAPFWSAREVDVLVACLWRCGVRVPLASEECGSFVPPWLHGNLARA